MGSQEQTYSNCMAIEMQRDMRMSLYAVHNKRQHLIYVMNTPLYYRYFVESAFDAITRNSAQFQ